MRIIDTPATEERGLSGQAVEMSKKRVENSGATSLVGNQPSILVCRGCGIVVGRPAAAMKAAIGLSMWLAFSAEASSIAPAIRKQPLTRESSVIHDPHE